MSCKNTVDQELIKDTYCKLTLFIEFKQHIESNNNQLNISELKNKLDLKYKTS